MQRLLMPPIHDGMPWYSIAKVTLFSEVRSPMVALLGCIFPAAQKEIRVPSALVEVEVGACHGQPRKHRYLSQTALHTVSSSATWGFEGRHVGSSLAMCWPEGLRPLASQAEFCLETAL